MRRIVIAPGFYIKKDGPDSYWLCHGTESDETFADASYVETAPWFGDRVSCTRIDYTLFKQLLVWRSRRVSEQPARRGAEVCDIPGCKAPAQFVVCSGHRPVGLPAEPDSGEPK